MLNISSQTARLIELHCDYFSRTGATAKSVQCRRENLSRMARELRCPLIEATFADLDTWQSTLTRRQKHHGRGGLSANTVACYTSHAIAFYRWAVDAGHLEYSPAERLPRPKRPIGAAHPVPESDLRLLLAVAPEPIRTWLLLAGLMGLRSMEIAQLRRDSVTEVEGRLVLSGIGKGEKPFQMVVPRHDVEPALRRYLATTGPLWTRPSGGPMTAHALTRTVSAWMKSQGMPYTLHWLRHSFGSELYAQTQDVLVTQRSLRHSSPNTTQIYVKLKAEAETAAMDRLAKRVLKPRRRKPGPADDGSVAPAA